MAQRPTSGQSAGWPHNTGVITYYNTRYVIELKRWAGPKAHQAGLKQLSDYLDMYSLKQGHLLIYDFNKNKEYKAEHISFRDKTIFAVWV